MKWIIFLLIISGCAQVTSLNMQQHEFGILPTKIIWFQIAGLEEEQLAMLRFQYAGERKTAFEESTCIGKSWNYNLYNLRNTAEATFLSQLTGKKNIKMTCEDANLRPIWSYLSGNGYNTGIFEIGASKQQSLVSLNECGEQGLVFLSSLYFWLRKEPAVGAQTFHYREPISLIPNQLMYDRTCDKQGCFSTITDDYKSLYQSFKKVSNKHFMIVRDFSYLSALDKRDFVKARAILSDLERSVAEALTLAKNSNDYLVLVTSGDSRFVDMPDQGKQWHEFEKTGANLQMKRTKLTNIVMATGARSENFCGMYDDSQVFERFLSGPKQLGLELKFINPFK
ncbi:MAG: hypothetical protein H0V66_09175 [Bdellovibrionales bacterium]|nr:hypothetical protein [Bdellovibrionales bacterium]